VLDAELCNNSKSNNSNSDDDPPLYQGPQSGVDKYALADLEVAREESLGGGETFCTVSHLGHLVRAGDIVLAYDLAGTVAGDWELESSLHSSFVTPDVIVVQKVAGNNSNNNDNVAAADDDTDDVPKRQRGTSKKQERRRKKEGKRMRELEESALRMGFIPDDYEAELAADPELAAEVSALERDLEALGASMEQQPSGEKDSGDNETAEDA